MGVNSPLFLMTTKKKTVKPDKPKKVKKPKEKTTGIVLIAFGPQGYGKAAFNLAMSIKYHNPNIKIAIIHDGNVLRDINTVFFDKMIKLPALACMRKDPAEIKTGIYNQLPFDNNLYLDVDAVCLKDLQPMIDLLQEKEGFYLTDVKGVGGKEDKKINYNIWAKNEDIWDFFSLKPDARLPAIQSSYSWIEKCDECKKYFIELQKFYRKRFPIAKLLMKWGGTLPDELLFSGVSARNEMVPQGGAHIFFGWQETKLTYEEITERHYLTAIYGNGRGNTLVKKRFIKWYTRLVDVCAKKYGTSAYDTRSIMRDKHANN